MKTTDTEPTVILKRESENAFALQFHEAELLVLPSAGGDNFTAEEQAALNRIVRACNDHAADKAKIKALVEGLEAAVNQLVFTLTDSDAWRGITPERAQSIKTTLAVARAALATA